VDVSTSSILILEETERQDRHKTKNMGKGIEKQEGKEGKQKRRNKSSLGARRNKRRN
jgi:hypothetical protein